MKKKIIPLNPLAALLTAVLLGLMSPALAQNLGISATGSPPNNSALLDVDATGMNPKKGVLIPRMTTAERNAIPSPATSLFIYNTTTGCFEFWDGSAWRVLSAQCAGGCIPPSGVSAAATPNPVCAGATLSLSGSGTGVTSWSWSGPNGFTSTLQNPTISGITSAGAGVYTLTASNSCGSATVTTASVTVNTVPTLSGISGPTSYNETKNGGGCLTSNAVYYTANVLSNGGSPITSYTWWSNCASLGGLSYGQTVDACFGGCANGNVLISVYATNACGNSNTVNISVTKSGYNCLCW